MNITGYSQFKQEILQARQLVLVDFWAPWCGPCRILKPILEQLAGEFNNQLKVCKINVDQEQALATRYQILSIPTLLFFKDGQLVSQITGVRSAAEIKKTIDSLNA